MLLDALDRTEHETCCCGSRRKGKILLWIAQKMKKYGCGSHRKCKILLWIVQKIKNIVVDRTEYDKYCGGSRRKSEIVL